MWQIKDEIFKKLRVRVKELRDAEDARARAVDTTLDTEQRESGRPGAGGLERGRPVDET
jgi:hypothetical protein